MKTKMKVSLLVPVIILLLGGCMLSPPEGVTVNQNEATTVNVETFHVPVDYNSISVIPVGRNVVCYVYKGDSSGSIDCLELETPGR